MKKRLMSAILAAGMLAGLLPGAAFAEEPAPAPEPTSLTEPQEPAVTENSAPAETPAVTEGSAPAETPAVTEGSAPAETPAVTEGSAPAGTPAVTEGSASAETPAVTEGSAPAETPAVTEGSAPAETPVVTESPAPTGARTISLGECYPDTSDLPDDDELFAGYLQSLLYGNGGVATFRASTLGDDLETTDELAYRIYSTVKPLIAEVAAGRLASTVFSVDVEDFQIATNQEGVTRLEAVRDKVLELLLLNCPYELYWYNKTQDGGLRLSGKTDDDDELFETLIFRFYVSEDYKGQDATTVNTEKTGAASAVVAEAQRVVDENADKTDYQKLVAYKDYICDHVSYNHPAMDNPDTPYGDPWQLIYVFDNDPTTNVVCEGYAKAFQYLCDLTEFTEDITCYNIPGEMDGGTGAGGHLWNIVTIDDKSYLVDLTNCDTGSIGAFGNLFLAGTENGSVSEKYSFYIPAYAKTIEYKYDQETIDTFPVAILTLEASSYVPAEEDAEASFARYNMGENGWFTGTVTILPPQGYTIGQTEEGATRSHFDVTAGGVVEYYLKNMTTGDVWGPKTITVKYDADKPTKPTLAVSTEATDTTVTLTAIATDATSGIQNYTLAEKNNKIAAQTCADGVFALTGLTPGATYSFTVTAKDNAGNASDASDACAVTMAKSAQAALTITGLPATVSYGDSFTLGTAGGSGSGAITWTVTAGPAAIDATGKVTLTGIGAVSLTATKAGDATYGSATATAGFTVASHTLPLPEEIQPDGELALMFQYGIPEVPAALQTNPALDTTEKIEAAMKEQVAKALANVPAENIKMMDIDLWYSAHSDGNWVKAEENQFPPQGFTVVVPYPVLNLDYATAQGMEFTVAHMISTGDDAGTIECPGYALAPDGLEFELYSLSPVVIAYRATPSATPAVSTAAPGKFTVNAWVNILEGGVVSPMGATTHNPGENLTYTIIPAQGYHIAKVTVDGVDVGAVGSYTFAALNRNHEIGAYFEKGTRNTIGLGTVSIPATGDEAPLALWYAMAAMAAVAFGALLAARRKRSK